MIVYTLSYLREYMQIPERAGLFAASGRDSYSPGRVALEATVLHSPFLQATYPFCMKTLFRSEKHCLLFGLSSAIGLFISAQSVGTALTTRELSVDPRLLSISLTIAFFTIISLRALFDIPSDRGTNWIFRLLIDPERNETRSVATMVILTPVAIWLVGVFPLHLVMLGWSMTLMHSVYVMLCSVALAQLLLLKFRKLPFTCSYTASKDRILAMVLLGMVAFTIFSETNSRIEARLLVHPREFALGVVGLIVLSWAVREYNARLPLRDRTLIFEDRPEPAVQILNIGK